MVSGYITSLIFSILILIGISFHIYRLRKSVDSQHGMMISMGMGTIAGVMTATLIVIPTGNFLDGVIYGTLVGLAFGLPLGKLGGHMGVLEGVMGGPMGGFMGAMLGQMIRPYNLDLFMIFFMSVFLLTMISISYAAHCRSSCCHPSTKKLKQTNFIAIWIPVCLVVLFMTLTLPYALSDSLESSENRQYYGIKTPDVVATAEQKDGYQEAELKATGIGYLPNVIIVKKDIPLKLKVTSDTRAGCLREVVFKDFGIRKILPIGSYDIIDITPIKAGNFTFSCSMDMFHGKLVVQ